MQILQDRMVKEGVVLLHGILRSKWSMALFARYLENKGFAVLNLDYPSSKHDIISLPDLIDIKVRAFAKEVSRIHFVGHSMGGLVIRAYLDRYKPNNLGRVVMIGTPNGGSEVADFLKDYWLYKRLFGPAGQQLVTRENKTLGDLAKINYELGIIAGQSSLYFFTRNIIRNANDGLVSIESTKLNNMKEHAIVNVGHAMLIFSKKVMRLVSTFLEVGRFS